MSRSAVWLLGLVVAVASLLSLTGMVTAQQYRLKEGHVLEHPKEVVGLVFSPDGKTIATICRDDDIRVWDVESGKEKWKLSHGTVDIYPLGFVDPNTLIVSRMKIDKESLRKRVLDYKLEVWDLTTHKVKRTITPPIASGEVGMASGSNIIAVGSVERDKPGVYLWDVTKGEKVGHLAQAEQPRGYAFTHDGKVMAVSTKSGVHVWDVAARKEKVYIPLKRPDDGIALAPDGKTLFLSAANADPIELYDIPGGELQYTASANCADDCLGCSSDGKVLVSARNSSLVLLEPGAGKRIYSYSSSSLSNALYVRTSPQGNLVATSRDQGKEVRLWKIEEKKEP